jgi:hypothetical protein
MQHLILTGFITTEGFCDSPHTEWGGCPTDAEGAESEEELETKNPQ